MCIRDFMVPSGMPYISDNSRYLYPSTKWLNISPCDKGMSLRILEMSLSIIRWSDTSSMRGSVANFLVVIEKADVFIVLLIRQALILIDKDITHDNEEP